MQNSRNPRDGKEAEQEFIHEEPTSVTTLDNPGVTMVRGPTVGFNLKPRIIYKPRNVQLGLLSRLLHVPMRVMLPCQLYSILPVVIDCL